MRSYIIGFSCELRLLSGKADKIETLNLQLRYRMGRTVYPALSPEWGL